MISKARIDIDFRKAIEQADELEELSGRICSLGDTGMEEALTLLTRSWKGENAADYIRKTNMLKDRMFGCAQTLNETARLIRGTAERIYAAEMAAISIIG